MHKQLHKRDSSHTEIKRRRRSAYQNDFGTDVRLSSARAYGTRKKTHTKIIVEEKAYGKCMRNEPRKSIQLVVAASVTYVCGRELCNTDQR